MARSRFDTFSQIIDAPQLPPFAASAGVLDSIQELAVGAPGSKGLRSDKQGIWLGAQSFAAAPFSVDMQGNMVANSAVFGQYLSKTGTGQNMSGTIVLGDNNIVLDGANRRITISESSLVRVLIGKQTGGF